MKIKKCCQTMEVHIQKLKGVYIENDMVFLRLLIINQGKQVPEQSSPYIDFCPFCGKKIEVEE